MCVELCGKCGFVGFVGDYDGVKIYFVCKLYGEMVEFVEVMDGDYVVGLCVGIV